MKQLFRWLKVFVQRLPVLRYLAHHTLRQLLRIKSFSPVRESQMIAWVADFSLSQKVDFINVDGICFNLNLREYVQARIYCYDYYEYDCVQAFVSLIKPGATMVDVGANIGQYSLLAAKLVGEKGTVIAFEPDPDISGYLQNHIDSNHFTVDVEHCALADQNGLQEFYPPGWEGNLGQGSLLPAEKIRSGIRKQEPLKVQVRRLDDVMQAKGIERIDFLKVDVEGYEMHVLKGAQDLLAKGAIKAMMVEVSPDNLQQTSGGYEPLLNYLTDFDYIPFVANRVGVLTPLELPIEADVNVFFLQAGVIP
ncbi:MAG: FkbM family methyltransferase [Ghiorsea sp.]